MSDKTNALDFSTVIASSVHDMKNSLGMLLGTLEEINGHCSTESCAANIKYSQLQYEGQRVNNHLMQLLTIYKIGCSDYTAKISENYIEDFLEECALQHEALLAPKGIEIETVCEDGLMGFFDRELVAGVVNNVVNNAYRYSKNKIRITGKSVNGYVVISVLDNGGGYPAGMMCDYSNGTASVDFSTGSTGLGLYFSSLVASLHTDKGKTGYITCANEGINGGGCFSVYLP